MSEPKEEPKFNFQLKSDVIEFLHDHYNDLQRFCEMLNTNDKYPHKIDAYEFAGEITKKFITEDTINKYDTSNPRANFNTWIQNILKNAFRDMYKAESKFADKHQDYDPLPDDIENDADISRIERKKDAIDKKYLEITSRFKEKSQSEKKLDQEKISRIIDKINQETNRVKRILLKLKFYADDVPLWKKSFTEEEIEFMLDRVPNEIKNSDSLFDYLDNNMLEYAEGDESDPDNPDPEIRVGLKNETIALLTGYKVGGISTVANRFVEKLKNNVSILES